VLCLPAFAQTNIFPSSGNAGIGTTTPQARLQLGALSNGTGEATHHGELLFSKQNTSLAATGGIEWKIAADNYGAKIDAIAGGGANIVFGLRNSSASWTEVMRINPVGNVGIGTATTYARLQVAGSSISQTTSGGGAGTGQFQAWAGGSAQGQRAAYSFYPTFESTPADNYVRRAADIIGGFNGGAWGNEFLAFHVGHNGASNDGQVLTLERMRIAGNGNVGIGTANPSHKLAVNGTVKAKEVIVETTGWSDYVFDEEYRLAPLSEVEQHIKEKKHLPGIPSASEVEQSGVSLGEMQARLLAKVEELTLHVISQNKRLDDQAARIATLERENQQLRNP
jgi:hypothetical protein